MVYRVSDDLALLQNHPLALRAESESAADFDLVSVPTDVFLKKFPNAPCEHQLHGIRKDLFDQATEWVWGHFNMGGYFGLDEIRIHAS